jgi:hypothetical protein
MVRRFLSTGRGAAHWASFDTARLISFSRPINSNSGVSYWLCGTQGEVYSVNLLKIFAKLSKCIINLCICAVIPNTINFQKLLRKT